MAKKSNPVPRYYWDSCVFLSIIEDDQARMPAIMAIMEEAEKQQVEIWTSMFTISEVAFAKAEKDGRALDAATQGKIDEFWKIGSPFSLVEPHRGIMTLAAQLVRDAMILGIRLTPPDAIHIATAKECGITTFHTYDEYKGKRQALSTMVGVSLTEPPLPRLHLFNRPETCDPARSIEPPILSERSDDQPVDDATHSSPVEIVEDEPIAVDAGGSPVRGDEHTAAEATGGNEEDVTSEEAEETTVEGAASIDEQRPDDATGRESNPH